MKYTKTYSLKNLWERYWYVVVAALIILLLFPCSWCDKDADEIRPPIDNICETK